MGKIDSVDEYIALQPASSQPVLQAIRAAITAALPDADEGISYDMPTYKLPGIATGVLHFAGWKKHASLYPASERIVDACADDLAAFVVDKGTIKLPLATPVPAALIAQIARLRADEVREQAKTKQQAKTKKPTTKPT